MCVCVRVCLSVCLRERVCMCMRAPLDILACHSYEKTERREKNLDPGKFALKTIR